MKTHKRKAGSALPVCWFLFSVTITFLILRMAHGQPQVYFKANAPAVKSLPRIGRRSDLETFPLPISPLINGLPQELQGDSWPSTYFYRGDHHQQQQQGRRDRGSSIATSEMDHLTPSQYFWRKFLGDPEISENAIQNLEDPTGNIYRSRMRK